MRSDDEPGTRPRLEHGQLCYLQIPARDIAASAEFYGAIFGWAVSPPDSGFEAPAMIGQFVDDRGAASDAGPLLWISVNDIDETLAKAASSGGRRITEVELDHGERWLATIADCAGNLVGIVQHGPRLIADAGSS